MRLPAVLILAVILVRPAAAQSGPAATIYRDAWGAPHVFSETDEGVLFGMAFALAEDDWPLIEENYLHALGRAGELRGEAVLPLDWYARAMEIARYSQREYAAASPRMQALLDAYAAGLNSWLSRNPGRNARLARIEPWYQLALIRFKYYVMEFLGYAGLEEEQTKRLIEHGFRPGAAGSADHGGALAPDAFSPLHNAGIGPWGDRPFGSNQWAVAPSRTANGHALLLINPHQSFVGVQRYAEIHIHSDQGLVFSGLTVFGFLLPYMGHSERLGWAYTDNFADHSDLYAETFVDSLRYRYGNELRTAVAWSDTIRVRRANGELDARAFRFWRTHHGPIVGVSADGRPLAAKLARYEEGGWFDQWDRMIRARDLVEWKRAAGMLNVAYMNIMYADSAGNIGYVYGSAVPRRLSGVAPRGILDGSDPRTEWQGFHDFAELPQVFNPPSGWLLNTNSSPFSATRDVPFSRADFPPYMVGMETNNPRAVSSARILEGLDDVTFDGFTRAVVDTRLSVADTMMPLIAAEWQRLQNAPEDTALADLRRLGPIVERLASWDRRSRAESVESAWFLLAFEQRAIAMRAGRTEWSWLSALDRAVRALEAGFGRRDVTWGEINRLQRPLPGQESLDSMRPSLPVHGAPSAVGSIFVFHTEGFGEARPRRGEHGNSFVKVIEFGPTVRARSILNFGQSGDPGSAHFFDQAPLYARGEFKPAWFTKEEVERNAVRKYQVR